MTATRPALEPLRRPGKISSTWPPSPALRSTFADVLRRIFRALGIDFDDQFHDRSILPPAQRSAFSQSSRPAPYDALPFFAPATRSADDVSFLMTCAGVRSGHFASTSAATPAT